MQIVSLEQALNSFDRATRMSALMELARLAAAGQIELAAEQPVVNMHCHTFFSFNAYGYSPAGLAWLAKKRGFRAVGIVDFDVLDGVEEFLDACEIVGVRGSAGIETRVFIPQFATREINSPGEPGVYYHMGIGFTSGRAEGAAAATLAALRGRAERRNREMLARLNDYLAPVTVDYDADVLPLTPAGNATERHMLVAIIRQATILMNDGPEAAPSRELLAFWSAKLGTPEAQIAAVIGDYARFSNLVRSKLMKKGGVGYVVPTPASFPTVEEYHSFIVACGALPTATWLDGTSAGEQAIEELMELLIGQGAVALNIIPDRNWNIADPDVRALKVRKLHEIVALAEQLDLPINVGTEMNAPGNKLVDDFDVPEMAPLRQAFLDGAHFIYGHTIMQRALGLGYQSDWARRHLPTRRERNAFYRAVGYRAAPGKATMARLRELDPTGSPEAILGRL
ncbi:MAG: hypothetical protein N2439_02120 [Anaerolineae bacterium]|nr:hypothetical protein [Anaerolineae bacterium]